MSADIQGAKRRLPLPELMRQLGYGAHVNTRGYVERQIRAGRLRACKPSGKFVRIFREDINAFLESCASIA
jgi:excisionase family DNA binding protein